MDDSTSSSKIETETLYPTGWHGIDVLAKIECRQMSADTYQLRSPTHVITITREGFTVFREDNKAVWNQWLEDNNIKSVPRDDL